MSEPKISEHAHRLVDDVVSCAVEAVDAAIEGGSSAAACRLVSAQSALVAYVASLEAVVPLVRRLSLNARTCAEEAEPGDPDFVALGQAASDVDHELDAVEAGGVCRREGCECVQFHDAEPAS